jgi:hypothetical protein
VPEVMPDDPRHGTYAGYQQHVINDRDEPCAPCRKANAKYHRKHRATHPERIQAERSRAAARGRALERLAAVYPAVFRALFEEELQR